MVDKHSIDHRSIFLYSLPIICSYILSFDSYLFHICFTAASHLLHICFTFALHLLYICVIFALHLLHICLTFALHLNCICLTSASHLPYISFRFASDLHYICITFALQSNHICFTFESHLPWNWFGLGWACFLAGATRVTASPESYQNWIREGSRIIGCPHVPPRAPASSAALGEVTAPPESYQDCAFFRPELLRLKP